MGREDGEWGRSGNTFRWNRRELSGRWHLSWDLNDDKEMIEQNLGKEYSRQRAQQVQRPWGRQRFKEQRERNPWGSINVSKPGSDYGITVHFLRCDNDGEVIWKNSLFLGDAHSSPERWFAMMSSTSFQIIQQRIRARGKMLTTVDSRWWV